jgi:hypothetical protein
VLEAKVLCPSAVDLKTTPNPFPNTQAPHDHHAKRFKQFQRKFEFEENMKKFDII